MLYSPHNVLTNDELIVRAQECLDNNGNAIFQELLNRFIAFNDQVKLMASRNQALDFSRKAFMEKGATK